MFSNVTLWRPPLPILKLTLQLKCWRVYLDIVSQEPRGLMSATVEFCTVKMFAAVLALRAFLIIF